MSEREIPEDDELEPEFIPLHGRALEEKVLDLLFESEMGVVSIADAVCESGADPDHIVEAFRALSRSGKGRVEGSLRRGWSFCRLDG